MTKTNSSRFVFQGGPCNQNINKKNSTDGNRRKFVFFSPIPTDKKTTEETLSGFFIVSADVNGNNDVNGGNANDADGNDETQRQ